MTRHIREALEVIDDAVREFDKAMRHTPAVDASELHLDRCYGLHVVDDMIIVHENHDRALQYYGGFEYVDPQYRTVYGKWIIYYRDDMRVDDHISYYEKNKAA